MSNLTPEGARLVADVAARSGFSNEAALAMLNAVAAGQGSQAQFNHPEFGGMGQWSQGGMIMVGDMFNHDLKNRVDRLCTELSGLVRNQSNWRPVTASSQSQSQGNGNFSLFVPGSGAANSWWPSNLGTPGSIGAQNDLRYAYFPENRRLAIDLHGQVRVYDTGNHLVSGFSQQQSGDQSLTFTSQFGPIRVADLPEVYPQAETPRTPPPPTTLATEPEPVPPPIAMMNPPPAAPLPPTAGTASAVLDVFATIERLAELRKKEILTEDEFAAKKAELLSRI